jgi:sugar lactone lactonase YvrE
MKRLVYAVVFVAACSDPHNQPIDGRPADTAKPIDAAPADEAPMVDAGPRGPAAFALPGVSYGLAWDNAASTLYITDDTGHRLLKWTDANGIQPFGTLSLTTTVLGEIQQLPDKSFLVPNLGQGTAGTLLTLSADGQTAGAITGLDATRRRIGITQDPNGLLYETYFTGNMMNMQTGGVALVTITRGAAVEAPITTSVALKKVDGIVSTTTNLYVCDTTANKVYSIVIAGGATTTLASPPSCDLLYKMPNGDLVTGGVTGGVYRITQAGALTTIRSGYEQVRGIAYDPTLQRMFVIEHRATLPTMPRLHVFPLDN